MRHAPKLLLALVFICAPLQAAPCERPLYLTFDVGNMRHAEHIARVLNEEDIHATFFLANNATYRGDHALDASWGPYWIARTNEGHAFGNHTWSHWYARADDSDRVIVADRRGHLRRLDQQQYCAELRKVDTTFRALTGKAISPIWRAPGGRTTPSTVHWATACGYPLHVGWSKAGLIGDELPSETFSNRMLVERAVKNLQPGDTILLHLGIRSRKQPFAEALQPLIRELKNSGYCFKTIAAGGEGG